ncbi:hypothetical protein EJB05_09408, partial [Eragrostis curvula]
MPFVAQREFAEATAASTPGTEKSPRPLFVLESFFKFASSEYDGFIKHFVSMGPKKLPVVQWEADNDMYEENANRIQTDDHCGTSMLASAIEIKAQVQLSYIGVFPAVLLVQSFGGGLL